MLASELKEKFDSQFNYYKQHLNDLQKLAPQTLTKRFELTVNTFFNKIGTQLDTMEQRLLNQLENSANMTQLVTLLKQHNTQGISN